MSEEIIIDGEVINNEWFLAAIKGDLNFLKSNAKDNIGKCGKDGCTAMMYAADMGFKDCVKFLSKFDEEVGKRDINGNTALMYCTKKGHIECVEILAELESNIVNNDKKKAIDFAIEYDFPECEGFLSNYEFIENSSENDDSANDTNSDDSNSEKNLIKEKKRLQNKLNILKKVNQVIDKSIGISDIKR